MSNWTPTTYKTTNRATYSRALKQRGSLSLWFDAAMRWEAAPSGKRGRQRAYSDAAIQAWRKIHIGIDAETLEIRAFEATRSSIGDAPVLPDLLNQIPPDEEIGSVKADDAFDTRKCHDPCAFRSRCDVLHE